MKTLTLNGGCAVATAAFAQSYESFCWNSDVVMMAFNFGTEQTFLDSLETRYGAHEFVAKNKIYWSDSTDTITLTTDAGLSVDSSQRTAQITNQSAQNDTFRLAYSYAGQLDVDLIWSTTSL